MGERSKAPSPPVALAAGPLDCANCGGRAKWLILACDQHDPTGALMRIKKILVDHASSAVTGAPGMTLALINREVDTALAGLPEGAKEARRAE